jgi:hypothetical protein
MGCRWITEARVVPGYVQDIEMAQIDRIAGQLYGLISRAARGAE